MKKTIAFSLLFFLTILPMKAQIYTPSGVIQGTSGNNNIGIGTTIPTQKLQVNGNIHLGSLNATLEMGNGDSSFSFGSIGFNNTTNDVVIKQKYTDGGIRFFTNTTVERMLIATNGNIGIGTTNPLAKLSIQSSSANSNGAFKLFGFTYPTDSSYWSEAQIAMMYNGVYRTVISSNGDSYFNSGNVGIGTSIPTQKLQVNGNIHLGSLNATLEMGNGDSPNSYGSIGFNNTTNDVVIKQKYTDGGIRFFTNTTAERMLVATNGNVGIGSTSPDSKLTVKGKIHAEEVKIDLAVPADYVFEKYYLGESSIKPDYNLLTLSEVEKFTAANHHLPNVPSAKEIKENGLLLGEMSNILLQKIEELTLYSIDQQKTIDKQATTIEKLEKDNEYFKKIEERLNRLEKELKAKK